ncbi:MAG TPA: VOC family protein [Bryobacteraceae bacterium]|jgi:uncharacterized glyoxalase superfamily protein PhnB|nr:VOC family protein [Bryobacteraceae bacterium]
MEIKRLTANLYADRIEDCVAFWVDRLQFEKTVEVPGEGGLVFAAVQKGAIELMYGTWASLEKDLGGTGAYQRGTSFLFVEVDDIAAAHAAMKDVPMIAARHNTFYGAREFTVADPAGHLITFAQFAPSSGRSLAVAARQHSQFTEPRTQVSGAF